MKFGYFANIHDPTQSRDYGEMIAEMRELAKFCDSTLETFGFLNIISASGGASCSAILDDGRRYCRAHRAYPSWASGRDHHLLASPPSRGRSRSADHLTGGRLGNRVGRGNYGLEASNLNPARSQQPGGQRQGVPGDARRVRKALTQDRFAHAAALCLSWPRISRRQGPLCHGRPLCRRCNRRTFRLTTYPRAKQKPMPPLWQVVSEDYESIRFCARNDMGVIVAPDRKETRRRLEAYKETWEAGSGRTLRWYARRWCATPSSPKVPTRPATLPARPPWMHSTLPTRGARIFRP